MGKFQRLTLLLLVSILAPTFGRSAVCAAEVRFALVIGNDEYKSAKLTTPANDAGLVADVLQAAGFTVTGARNLDQSTLRESFREFLGQVAAAGPDAVALVYLSGFGLQFAGENYFAPVDADIQRDVDVPLQAIRISDFTQPLAALPGRVKIVILDAARQNPFARGGQPLASGLALVDPARGLAIAFNAAPGTIGPDEPGPYGAYATALTEMIATGGLTLDDLFERTRLRVSEVTQGAEVPWYASQIDGAFLMTERIANAPTPSVVPLADLRSKPMRSYSTAEDAYAAALALDSIEGYEQFLAIYPNSPFSRRVALMLAVRREEMIWRRAVVYNTAPAYWSYLRHYPRGPHVWDARRRLTMLGAPLDPPPAFAVVEFGVPLPIANELALLAQPVLMFWGPGFVPPPPPPVIFLPPRPREFAVLPPPPPSRERSALPIPGVTVIPATVKPPRTVTVPQLPPGGAGRVPVALPGAVHAPGTPGGPSGAGARPEERRVAPPAAQPPTQPSAPTAAVKPAAPLPHPAGPAPAAVKPAPPPPHPAPPTAATAKPAPPPPPPAAPAPAAVKPAPPPPHPAAPAAPAGRPACPPGKTLVNVNGQPTCK